MEQKLAQAMKQRLTEELEHRLKAEGLPLLFALCDTIDPDDLTPRVDLHVFDLSPPRAKIVDLLIDIMFDLEDKGLISDFLVRPHSDDLESGDRQQILNQAFKIIELRHG